MTVQPTPIKRKYQNRVPLSVTANNATTYQWQVRRKQDGFWENAVGSGQTSKTFYPNAECYGTYEYRCLVGNTAFTQNDRIMSDTVLVSTVIDFTRLYERPVIIEQKAVKPKVKIGEGNAVYEVTAKGKDITFNWQYSNKIDSWWQAVGAMGSVRNTVLKTEGDVKTIKSVLTMSTANNTFLLGEIRCVVNDLHFKSELGTTSDNMLYLAVKDDNETGIVYQKIEWTKEPKSQKVYIGEVAQFSAEASGVDVYKWQYKKNQAEDFWQDVDSKLGTSHDIATGWQTKTLKVNTSHITYNADTKQYENDLSGYLFRCLVSSSAVPEVTSSSDTALLVCAEEQGTTPIVFHNTNGVFYVRVPVQNGKTGKELQKINRATDANREMVISYLGELKKATMEISLEQKEVDGTYRSVANAQNYITIKDAIKNENVPFLEEKNVYCQENIAETQTYQATFLNAMPQGTYKLTFVLKDITGQRIASEALVWKVE